MAVVLLAVARTEDTGAAAPAGAVDEADVAVPVVLDGAMGAVLLATTCTRCTQGQQHQDVRAWRRRC